MKLSVKSSLRTLLARLKKYRVHLAAVFPVAAALAAVCSDSERTAAILGGAAVVLLAGIGAVLGYREYRKRQVLSLRWLVSFLKSRGLAPEVDADGDVLFRIDNMKYVLHFKEHYFELHIGFGRKRSELNDELMARMAQEVMNSMRMVKILLRSEAVLFSIECLQRRRSEFAEFFDSYIRILKFSVTEHTRRYNEALEAFHQEIRRQREEEDLSRRFSDYQGKDVVN